MGIHPFLYREIVECVLAVKDSQKSNFLYSREGAMTLLLMSELNEVMPEMDLYGVPWSSACLIVERLYRYGRLANGQNALDVFLKNIEDIVEENEKAKLRSLREQLSVNEHEEIILSNKQELKNSIHLSEELENIANYVLSIGSTHFLSTYDSRKALLFSSGLDDELISEIDMHGAPREFIYRLIDQLEQYGTLLDGRNALDALLIGIEHFIWKKAQDELRLLHQKLQDKRKQEASQI